MSNTPSWVKWLILAGAVIGILAVIVIQIVDAVQRHG